MKLFHKKDEVQCHKCKRKFEKEGMQNYFGAYYCPECWKIVHQRKSKSLSEIGREFGI